MVNRKIVALSFMSIMNRIQDAKLDESIMNESYKMSNLMTITIKLYWEQME